MNRLLSFAVALSCALAWALPASAATVNLPAGTKVTVRLVNQISSGNATPGQRFTFEAADPVTVGSRVVIAEGAKGTGHVVRAVKAHGKSAGEMTLAFASIHAADGTPVSLTEVSSTKGNPEKGKASTATIAATIALGPIGLLAHNMVKGKDVVVGPKQTFPAWVKNTTPITLP